MLAGLLVLVACPDEPKLEIGARCDSDEACSSGNCVGDGSGRPFGRCTRPCAESSDCPDGWSCGAITTRGEAVCVEGDGIPLVPSRRAASATHREAP